MIQYRKILEMAQEGLSLRTVSASTGHGRPKVTEILHEYCKCIEPPVRRNEPLNARNRASYCEQESRPTIFIYRTNLLYNEVACLRA